jgi:hypothetical protein
VSTGGSCSVTERARREFRCPLNCAISFFLHQVPAGGPGALSVGGGGGVPPPEDVGAVLGQVPQHARGGTEKWKLVPLDRQGKVSFQKVLMTIRKFVVQ